jgi:hypothetical protein
VGQRVCSVAFRWDSHSLVSFQNFAQKSIKIRKWFWESFRVGPDLEHGQIENWNFDANALLKSAKIKLRLTISKFHLYTAFLDYLC